MPISITIQAKVHVRSARKRSAAQPPFPAALPVTVLAFASGFLALALEVLWTRMFVQVLQNSVYSFAVILVTFLLGLAGGALLAHLLCRARLPAGTVFSVLLTLSGCLVGLSPLLFYQLTNGLSYLAAREGWESYIVTLFLTANLVLLAPTLCLGTVFPYLLKASATPDSGVGQILGRLTAINTLGAILGSLCTGFLLLEMVGLWTSINGCHSTNSHSKSS